MKSFILLFILFGALQAQAQFVRIGDDMDQRKVMAMVMSSLHPTYPSQCFGIYDDGHAAGYYIDIYSKAFDNGRDALAAVGNGTAERYESRQYGLGYMYQDASAHQIAIAGDSTPWEYSRAKMTIQFDAQMKKVIGVHFDLAVFANKSVDCPVVP